MNDLEDVKNLLEDLKPPSRSIREQEAKKWIDNAVEVIEEYQEYDSSGNRKEYHRTSVSRGKARGNYYPRLSFQKEVLEEIGFTYKTPLKVEVDFDDEEVTFYKE